MFAAIGNLASNVGANILAAGAFALLVWFRDFAVFRAALIGRWLYSTVTRRHYVLVWVDDERGYSRKLIRHLRHKCGRHGAIFRAIKRPRAILYHPRNSSRTRAIVLLDTDVSKLADEPKLRSRIETRLRDYVENGGGLVGSHDLIYRRVRAEKVQEVFGCQITNFRSSGTQPVPYRRVDSSHAVLNGLDDRFELDDGEVCWGEWAPDADVLCVSDDEHETPLVVAREYADGRVVWVNSGDKGKHLCASVAKPQEALVTLLANSLEWVGEARA